jgi:putative salt-induced outer membrane protein
MRLIDRILAAGLVLCPIAIVHADDPPPPPQGWTGKGELGFVDAKGNTDSNTLNAKLGLSDQVGPWKHSLTVDVIKGSTNGLTAVDHKDATWQSNYDLTTADYVFGNLTYINDQLSGYRYQANGTVGYGRKLIFTDDTKLTAQLGVGYGQVQPQTPVKDDVGNLIGEIYGTKESSAVVQGEVKLEQVLTDTTKIVDDLKVTYQSIDTYVQNDLALQVKVSSKLALSLGYGLRHNTSVAFGVKATDTLTTVNLVYSF